MLKLIKKLFKKQKATLPLRNELEPIIDLESYKQLLYTFLKPIKKEASKHPEHYLNTLIILLEGELENNKAENQSELIEKCVKEINKYIK